MQDEQTPVVQGSAAPADDQTTPTVAEPVQPETSSDTEAAEPSSEAAPAGEGAVAPASDQPAAAVAPEAVPAEAEDVVDDEDEKGGEVAEASDEPDAA
jgi:hypothetical protein